jgi:hypothetical protein
VELGVVIMVVVVELVDGEHLMEHHQVVILQGQPL